MNRQLESFSFLGGCICLTGELAYFDVHIMRAGTLVGQNLGAAVSKQGLKANAAAKNQQLIPAAIGRRTADRKHAQAQYGSQRVLMHTIPPCRTKV